MNSTHPGAEEATKGLLFGQVNFHLVLSDKLGDPAANKVNFHFSYELFHPLKS